MMLLFDCDLIDNVVDYCGDVEAEALIPLLGGNCIFLEVDDLACLNESMLYRVFDCLACEMLYVSVDQFWNDWSEFVECCLEVL